MFLKPIPRPELCNLNVVNMKAKWLTTLFYLLAIAVAMPSTETYAQTPTTYQQKSQFGDGVVNSAGQWAQQIGTVGAQANRNTANQLFQQALQHEAQGIATLNVGLLSQSLTEAREGIKADDQSRHFAQTALQALQSGNAGGNVDLEGKYGTSQDSMRNLANTSSSLLPEVQSKMNGFGIQVNHDKTLINTPFGQFPVDAGPEDMARAIGKIAGHFGLSGDSAAAGVAAGLANAQAIAAKALADAQAAAGANGGRAVASDAAGKAGDAGAAKDAGKDSKDAAAGAKAADKAVAAKDLKDSGGLTAQEDLQRRMADLAKSRAELAALYGTKDSIGGKDDSLYGIVHNRYQEMRHQGAFNEYAPPSAPVPPVVAAALTSVPARAPAAVAPAAAQPKVAMTAPAAAGSH